MYIALQELKGAVFPGKGHGKLSLESAVVIHIAQNFIELKIEKPDESKSRHL